MDLVAERTQQLWPMVLERMPVGMGCMDAQPVLPSLVSSILHVDFETKPKKNEEQNFVSLKLIESL